jgi:hypothetical protein
MIHDFARGDSALDRTVISGAIRSTLRRSVNHISEPMRSARNYPLPPVVREAGELVHPVR